MGNEYGAIPALEQWMAQRPGAVFNAVASPEYNRFAALDLSASMERVHNPAPAVK